MQYMKENKFAPCVDTYLGLDVLQTKVKGEGLRAGTVVVLSTFFGHPRNMQENYQDVENSVSQTDPSPVLAILNDRSSLPAPPFTKD